MTVRRPPLSDASILVTGGTGSFGTRFVETVLEHHRPRRLVVLSRDELNVTPTLTANLNLWWYPIEGVQMRVGYNALTFFNTMYMQNPIGFNYSAIDPVYETKYFRILHGVNVGVGLFF